jgi:hypothetical protein
VRRRARGTFPNARAAEASFPLISAGNVSALTDVRPCMGYYVVQPNTLEWDEYSQPGFADFSLVSCRNSGPRRNHSLDCDGS